MAFDKQIAILGLPLPMELLDIVKSYCFYDTETAKKIKEYKQNFANILLTFDRQLEFQSTEYDNEGHWGVALIEQEEWSDTDSRVYHDDYDDPYIEKLIAACNCLSCGNYKYCNNIGNDMIPARIICACAVGMRAHN